MAKKVLITGAGGFIGGFIVAEALRRGLDTWAAVRPSTKRDFLTDPRIHIIELDFTNSITLKQQIAKAVDEFGQWDYVIHNLGATKCTNFSDFNKINYSYLRTFVDVLRGINAVPEAFLLMSSLSAMGVGDEVSYSPLTTAMIPHPNTRYGVSKLKAETYLQTLENFPYIIFRGTGVYGPHEKDYYLMMKCIKRGFDFSVGMKKQMLTFIYVKDLAAAMFDALDAGAKRKAYIISEPRAYTQKEFRAIVAKELGKKVVIPVCCPMWIVYLVSRIAEWFGVLTMKPSTLNRDKYKIMKQRNWNCDISDAQRDFNFNPRYSLEKGVHEAIEWYRQEGWL
jgi:nucleoside-diphosphate-sugar epimerase